ncbi:hypothetical protein LIER_30177 [Lithospermum erythrorhizon]|uniref:Uncharacterized protein n=1 Tax=Lithospermum erythrorhizon TaxID=34254 RepID=A0AAV3RQF9_LITER
MESPLEGEQLGCVKYKASGFSKKRTLIPLLLEDIITNSRLHKGVSLAFHYKFFDLGKSTCGGLNLSVTENMHEIEDSLEILISQCCKLLH